MYQEANNKTIVLLSAGRSHVKPVVIHVVLACCGKGAELQQRNMPCFVSLIFHVLRKKTGWESGAVSALFVLYLVL